MPKQIQLLAACILLMASISTHAQQQKTGDVVEIFGREVVSSAEEGAIWHEFSQGLLLMNAASYSRNSIPQDLLLQKMFSPQWSSPQAGEHFGEVLPISERSARMFEQFTGTKADPAKLGQWEAIEAKEGLFKDLRLRLSQLYLKAESEHEFIALLETSGNTLSLVNGLPREGDHYDFGWTLTPFKVKKGQNEFMLTSGRRDYIKARILIPRQPILFSRRDLTLPDMIRGEGENIWGAIRVINASEEEVKDLEIHCSIQNLPQLVTQATRLAPLQLGKVPFEIPIPSVLKEEKDKILLSLVHQGRVIDTCTIMIHVKEPHEHHKRTFRSQIDNSIQYYSVAPCSQPELAKPAMVLSVHGASVEATNQARAYKAKDWAHIVAPTNRRPFGFAWEDWGRWDAIEVLEDAEKHFQTDRQRTYLTGHSMGGHGTWQIGVTFPDRFAAIAPCAGYPDLMNYGRAYLDLTKKETDPIQAMFARAGKASRTQLLARNYLHHGVYIYHGEADKVVTVEHAREMRQLLGTFHNDFCHYEYPNGSHWYSNESVDWKPLFDYFKWHYIPASDKVKKIEFHTASPGISSSSHWITIQQQELNNEISSIKAQIDSTTISCETENIAFFSIDIKKAQVSGEKWIIVDGQQLKGQAEDQLHLVKQAGKWQLSSTAPAAKEKNPARYGGFKDAYNKHMVFVYATQGSKEENEWYLNKARFDSETFLYRGNASIELISDKEFRPQDYPDRNIILYGNRANNKAWNSLLKNCPIQIGSKSISIAGRKTLQGKHLASYFIYPREDSDIACIGVVAGTGEEGMKACFANQYFIAGSAFPDLMIFNSSILSKGQEAIHLIGYFGRDWSVINGSFSEQ